MGRYFVGTLAPGQTIRPALSFATPFNPAGDWGGSYVLAHPRTADAQLVCDFHGKMLDSTTGRYFYILSITNRGPLATEVDVDF
ncbi:hypothetical protein ACFQS1_25470 [Paractinoplanes rhizophilus]|jgi:hypothetical protein|uniref:Uncharacterized protein n=1 Tax=Paractinoplanes rhizophilus TaxID=1416877 RepID=A0ABW2HWY6_9ACTN|nr:hypothetical protein [Actinoplanes sp.]